MNISFRFYIHLPSFLFLDSSALLVLINQSSQTNVISTALKQDTIHRLEFILVKAFLRSLPPLPAKLLEHLPFLRAKLNDLLPLGENLGIPTAFFLEFQRDLSIHVSADPHSPAFSWFRLSIICFMLVLIQALLPHLKESGFSQLLDFIFPASPSGESPTHRFVSAVNVWPCAIGNVFYAFFRRSAFAA